MMQRKSVTLNCTQTTEHNRIATFRNNFVQKAQKKQIKKLI